MSPTVRNYAIEIPTTSMLFLREWKDYQVDSCPIPVTHIRLALQTTVVDRHTRLSFYVLTFIWVFLLA